MNIIPQEKEADKEKLTETLNSTLEFTAPINAVRVFLFGSWATYQKSFTEGDVDVFIGTENYCYDDSPTLATTTARNIPVHTTDGDVYPEQRIELHWGDITDFLKETSDWERVEITVK